MTDKRLTIRLTQETVEKFADLRALLGVTSDAAVVRRLVDDAHKAASMNGSLRALQRFRVATEDRQLSLLDRAAPKKSSRRRVAKKSKRATK